MKRVKVSPRLISSKRGNANHPQTKGKSLKDLIGFELIALTKTHMIVSKDGQEFTLEFTASDGDCCGFSSIDTVLFRQDDNRPVITNVQYDREDLDGQFVRVTFFGMSKPIAALDASASSGSLWPYGATVMVTCHPLGLEEILANW